MPAQLPLLLRIPRLCVQLQILLLLWPDPWIPVRLPLIPVHFLIVCRGLRIVAGLSRATDPQEALLRGIVRHQEPITRKPARHRWCVTILHSLASNPEEGLYHRDEVIPVQLRGRHTQTAMRETGQGTVALI